MHVGITGDAALRGSGLLEATFQELEARADAAGAQGMQCTMRASYLEVVGDSVHDLLAARPGVSAVEIRDSQADRDPQVTGCDEVRRPSCC